MHAGNPLNLGNCLWARELCCFVGLVVSSQKLFSLRQPRSFNLFWGPVCDVISGDLEIGGVLAKRG